MIAFPEAEKAILSVLLMPSAPVAQIMSNIGTEDFSEGSYLTLFKYIHELYLNGESIDMLKLAEMIHTRKPLQLTLLDLTYIEEYKPQMCVSNIYQILRNYRLRRQTQMILIRLQQHVEDLNTDIEALLSNASVDLSNLLLDRTEEVITLSTAVARVANEQEENLHPETRHECVKSGFRRIDNSGGLPPVGVTVIAADTGHGKSSMAVDLAMENIRQGEKVAFYNLEMPTVDVARRIVAGLTGIPFHELAHGIPSEEDLAKVNNALRQIISTGGDRFFFDERYPDSVDDIICSIRRLADKKGKGVTHFYIDYLQILSWAGNQKKMQWQNIEQILAQATRQFHNLCLQLKIQIVITSQVNRDLSHSELTLERIRDSKQIADAATCVLLLQRPEAYKEGYKTSEFRHVSPLGTALLDIAKRRNGPCFKFIVGFDAVRTSFYELDKIPRIEESTQEYDLFKS